MSQEVPSHKRQREAVDPFGFQKAVTYALLYFKNDLTYLSVSSISRALPSNLLGSDLRNLPRKSSVTLKNGWCGVVVDVSDNEQHIFTLRQTLERKLQEREESRDVSLSQLGSLDLDSRDITSKFANSQHEHFQTSDSENESDTENSKFTAANSKSDDKQDLILSEIKAISKKLAQIASDQEKIKKDLHAIKKKAFKTEDHEKKDTVEAVMFEGVDVANLGQNNMDPSHFGVCLARHLFTDEELRDNMLFPQRSSSRPPLSPKRSDVFRLAINSRFSPEALDEASRAVNCLGNDLKKGRRWRKKIGVKFNQEKSTEHHSNDS